MLFSLIARVPVVMDIVPKYLFSRKKRIIFKIYKQFSNIIRHLGPDSRSHSSEILIFEKKILKIC